MNHGAVREVPRPVLRGLVWIYCLSWAFDFRGITEGGSPVQFALFGVTLASGAAVALLGGRSILALPTAWLVVLWWGHLAATPLVAVLNGVSLHHFARNAVPPVLLGLSLLVTQVASSRGLSIRDVVIPCVVAGLVNVFWRIFYALVVAGIPFETVRVELLSPSLPFLLAFGAAGVGLAPRMAWGALLVAGVAVASFLVSITRSFALVAAAAAAGVAVAWWLGARRGVFGRRFVLLKGAHLAVAGAGMALLGAAIVWWEPVVVERWVVRLLDPPGGASMTVDASLLTRQAETAAFVDILRSDPTAWIWGRGLGAAYHWDESFLPELALMYPDVDVFRADIFFPGHSIWTYAVFSAGLIGLAVHAAFFGGGLALAVRGALLARPGDPRLAEHFLPLIGLLCYLSQSLTFNPFIERTGGLLIGILVGLPQFAVARAFRERRAIAGTRTGEARPSVPSA